MIIFDWIRKRLKEFRHDFRYDLGIGLIGKYMVGKEVIDTSGVVDNLEVSIDGKGFVYHVGFEIKRPKEKLNQLKQRMSVIRVLRENMGGIAYQSYDTLLKNNKIRFPKIGYSYHLNETSMDIIYTNETIYFELINISMLDKNGEYREVLNDYKENKKVIEL